MIENATFTIGRRSAAAIVAALGLLRDHAHDGYESPEILDIGAPLNVCDRMPDSEIAELMEIIAAPFGVGMASDLPGYSVNADGRGGWQWNRDTPGVSAGCAGYSSEAAAWEAARKDWNEPPAPGEFTKAIMADYTVEAAGDGSWLMFDDGMETGPNQGYPTERAAWEAADRHRMTGEV